MSDPLTYLDFASTVPLRPEVAEAMAAVLAEPLGNPTGSHPAAQRARCLLEEARDEVADVLGRPAADIVFTSGGTESANLAVLGPVEAARLAGQSDAVVLSSAVEHPAVRQACHAATQLGADARELPVDRAGVLDLDALTRALSSRITLVAVMTANNETGVVQPVRAVAEAVHSRAPHAVVFSDAVQAAPFLDLREACAGADLISLSAHKVGGPVGTGALVVGAGVALSARQHGGGQERERRSGTQDVVGAVGLATALRLAAAERGGAGAVSERRDRLAVGLLDALPEAQRTVPAGIAVLPGHLHLCIAGIEREELLVALGAQGLCVSGGSSCASGALEPSPVLAAMGVPAELAAGAIRFSLGARTSDEDVERALQVVPAAVAALRVRA
jgi:cysteine desulfurase